MTSVLLLRRWCLAILALLITTPTFLSAQGDDERLTVKVRDQAENSAIIGATVTLYDDAGALFREGMSDENGEVVFNFSSSSVNNAGSFATRLGEPGPNPVTSRTTLPLSLGSSEMIRVGLYDILGRQVTSIEGYMSAGDQSIEINLGDLNPGRYFVRVLGAGEFVGSASLQYLGAGQGSPSLRLGGGAFSADKSIPGTYKMEVTHPDYRTYVMENITITGKSLQFALMRQVFAVAEFGTGTPEYTVIADGRSGLDVPRDLEFNPAGNNELWVVNRSFDGTVTYYNAGTDSMESLRVQDIWGLHFMEEVSAIAFGPDGFFGTAQETNNTYNGQAAGNNFTGPALWTSDTSIYSKSTGEGWGELGSHLDMLHESPFGMGIAHDNGNAYWYFDGFYGNIVYYDFQQDHGPGWDDHSDGIVRRYMDATVTRVPNVPGHLILDKETGWLYIADVGGKRITRLNTKSGAATAGGNIDGSQMENLQEYTRYTGATYEIFAEDDLVRPSGIALHQGRLFVSDNATGEIIAYDMEGTELNRIKTPAESLMGIEIGPDGKIWYVDAERNQVIRVDPTTAD